MLCIGYDKSAVNPETGEIWQPFPCGKCIPCKVNHQRDWKARFILETMVYGFPAWVTLNYYPETEPLCVERDHIRRFIRNLTKHHHQIIEYLGLPYVPLRYFCKAEYDPHRGFPHYHLLIWNHRVAFQPDPRNPRRRVDPVIEKAWSEFGSSYTVNSSESFSFHGKNAVTNRFDYVTAYLLDKAKVGSLWPEDMKPEFISATRIPAIGKAEPIVERFMRLLTGEQGKYVLAANQGLPKTFRYEGKWWPLPKILRRHLDDRISHEITSWIPGIKQDMFWLNFNTDGVVELREGTVEEKRYKAEEAEYGAQKKARNQKRKAKYQSPGQKAATAAARKALYQEGNPPDARTVQSWIQDYHPDIFEPPPAELDYYAKDAAFIRSQAKKTPGQEDT